MRRTLLAVLGTTTAVLFGGAIIGVLVSPSSIVLEDAAAAPSTSAPVRLSPEAVTVSFPGYAAPASDQVATEAPVDPVPSPTVPIPVPGPAPEPDASPEVLGSVDVEQAALARLSVDWRALLPGWRLEFPGPRAGFRGATFPREHLIQIYVRSGQSVDEVAHVIGHELGHAVDVTYFGTAERAAFHVLRGRSAGTSWFVADGESDFASGAGDWAETFSWVVTGGAGEWRSELGGPPSPIQIAGVKELIR